MELALERSSRRALVGALCNRETAAVACRAVMAGPGTRGSSHAGSAGDCAMLLAHWGRALHEGGGVAALVAGQACEAAVLLLKAHAPGSAGGAWGGEWDVAVGAAEAFGALAGAVALEDGLPLLVTLEAPLGGTSSGGSGSGSTPPSSPGGAVLTSTTAASSGGTILTGAPQLLFGGPFPHASRGLSMGHRGATGLCQRGATRQMLRALRPAALDGGSAASCALGAFLCLLEAGARAGEEVREVLRKQCALDALVEALAGVVGVAGGGSFSFVPPRPRGGGELDAGRHHSTSSSGASSSGSGSATTSSSATSATSSTASGLHHYHQLLQRATSLRSHEVEETLLHYLALLANRLVDGGLLEATVGGLNAAAGYLCTAILPGPLKTFSPASGSSSSSGSSSGSGSALSSPPPSPLAHSERRPGDTLTRPLLLLGLLAKHGAAAPGAAGGGGCSQWHRRGLLQRCRLWQQQCQQRQQWWW